MKKIKFEISDEGVSIDYQGFIGKQCMSEEAEIKKALENLGVNANIDVVKYKPEYYNTTVKDKSVRTT